LAQVGSDLVADNDTMKCFSLVVLLTGLSLSPVEADANPVSRVATLLQNLASKIDSELDTDTKLYEDYECWAKTVISSKTASNEKAQSRVDSLKTYLADLDAGRIELTSERTDLEKEVAGLNKDLETAAALREKENEDYVAATKEMDQAIKAMEAAIKVLDEATKDSKASLVNIRSSISQRALEGENEGFSTRVAEADALQKAVDVGSRWLKAGDALFLRRLLSGEVPIADWKKLNRKAEFKMKYKARSVKIQDTLAKLLASFKENKKDAEEREKDAKETYEQLKEAKEKQLGASQEALTKGDVEGGAKAVSKEDAKSEIKALETQIKDDKKYISETEDALKTKKEEFVERKGLRIGEIKAINEAIAVIHSDDARDLFKRSISFLQVVDSAATSATVRASSSIRDAARTTGDLRLSALAARISLASGGKFSKVLTAIDKMIKTLEDEDKDDADNKGDCESDREKNTKEAADYSREIDELSDDIEKLEGEIEEIVKEVAEKEESVKDLKKELKEAKKIREEENAEWKSNDADDTAAIKLLEKAAGVLKDHYKENFSLVQQKKDAPQVTAGEAPPPPPKTWEEPYGGAQKESQGIVGILELIKTDCEKDQKAAKKAEDDAKDKYDKFKKESEDSIDKLNKAINDLEESKGKKEKDIESKKSSSKNKKGSLDTVVKKMKEAQPGCDFLLVNFKVRSENRKLEIKGLKKAKEILEKENK